MTKIGISDIAIIISSLVLISVLISAIKDCLNADTYDMTGLNNEN